MTARTWQQEAGEALGAAIDAHARPWALHRKGLIATARSDYRSRPLPRSFELREVDARGAIRRVALAPGIGRPLVVLPGMFAKVTESLFTQVAALARARLGRPVALLEDRFAAGTLSLNGSFIPSTARLGSEVAEVVARLWPAGERPDLLAMSAGAAQGLAAPPDTFRAIALFSAALDANRILALIARRPAVDYYFSRLCARACREASVRPFDLRELGERLSVDGPPPPPSAPIVAVHAVDDPVAPASQLARLEGTANVVVRLVRVGGHLGFGPIAGPEVYVLPFELPTIEGNRAGSRRPSSPP